MKTYVLYHANCSDGFGSAYAAWKKFKGNAEYLPVNYSEPVPKLDPGSTVYLLDFSYKKETLINLSKEMGKVIVIDHHHTSYEALKDATEFETVFSMENSGAILSWNYFHKEPTPDFLKYIEDRDLWKFLLPESEEVSTALFSYPYDFELWDTALDIDKLKIEGRTIKRYRDLLVDRVCLSALWIEISGYKVPAVNSMLFQSEACRKLLDLNPSAPFSACFYIGESDKTYWSLRSSKGFDVSEIAKKYGGGGHKAAAGFSLDGINISKAF